MSRASELMMIPLVLSALTPGAHGYLSQTPDIGKSKTQRGTICRCCVCGEARTTLYKDGDKRICGKCRNAAQTF